MTPDNVAGLVVGEGCFYTESQPDRKYRLGWRIRPGFCIEMRNDDRDVLEQVREHMRCGSIYTLDFGRYRGYESRGWEPHAKYRVSSIRDLHNEVVPFFRRHPLFGRKKEAFDLFAQLVEALYGGKHRCPQGLDNARHLAELLGAHNARGRSPRGPVEGRLPSIISGTVAST